MSSGEQRGPRLPEQAEAILSDWPAADKGEAYWEERALDVTKKLGDVAPGSTPDALLAAPLPAEPDEGVPHDFPRASPAAAARPQSLADLARAVRDSKPEESLRDMAEASLSLSSRARGGAPEVAARLKAKSAAATSTPLPETAASASNAPAAEAKGAAAEPESRAQPRASAAKRSADVSKQTRASEPARSRGIAPVLMAAAAALAVAAAVLIVVKTRTQSSEPVAVGEPAPAVASAAPEATATPPSEQPGAIALEDPARSVPKAAPAPALAPRPAPNGEKHALRAAKPGEKPERVVLEESPVKPPPAEAPSKPAASVDPNEPPLRPADGKSAELPDKPAAGAVQAAINSVKASAAACIAAHDEASTAVISFGSDGRVRSVVVGGGAANTPAAGCIRSALMKARVAPFAKDSFNVSTTIRPP